MHELFKQHIEILSARFDRALQACNLEALLLGSGQAPRRFLDDNHYPFRAHPPFVQWLPHLTQHPGSWLLLRPGRMPVLYLYCPDDFWHQTPEAPTGDWTRCFEIECFADPNWLGTALAGLGRTALIAAERPAFAAQDWQHNPAALMTRLDFERAIKTDWELACLRRANHIAAAGHIAAQQLFATGASEYRIHQGYLAATDHNERDLPYDNIVALNEHAAVLHYQFQQREIPAVHRTLLFDAGATHLGYAADITRTHVADASSRFAELVAALDSAQQALLPQVRAGADFPELHRQMHQRLAQILADSGLVRASVEAQLEQGITRTFFPHGLGHLLGLQVHDVGGWQQDSVGTLREPPLEHPFLRLTRTLEPGYVVTIEPGLYFIPSLLERLRQAPAGRVVDWSGVEALLPYGGIRIEDNVAVTEEGSENFTRDAFAAAGQEGF
ncbi:Xaa-Pro dipeptidase [Marinobacterium nitratireducens]|uniref:Xaa-Pro dipeptidase n=1 Tax=Marinobacterium nitratireducens TaxID=518897 RepID=A0A917ZHW8_9GAMM|nr:Xaa-Pro dipeptidase [Marinobacterium nitratireducens]GGO82966.1 Xaa-Pro dipeptidase [Marinobacterium nitratireducens]